MTDIKTKKPDGKIRFFYGVGAMPYGIKDHGFSFFLLIFYSQVLGLPAQWTSAALAIAIVIDAISDPIIGYVSDNWRSRWGRRHPFMYISIIPICLSYVFLWNPPLDILTTQQSLFIYLLVMTVFIRTLITLFEVPNTALISEFTDDYDLRTALMGTRYMFGWLGGVGMAILGYTVFLADKGVLAADGYGTYGLAAAGLMAVGMILSATGTHRAIADLHMPPPRARPRLRDVFRELAATLRNYSFRVLFIASIFSGASVGLTSALSIYFGTYFWGLSPRELGFFNMLYVPAALCALPIAYYLGKKFEKKQAALGTFSLMIFLAPLMQFARLADLLPQNGDPLLFNLLALHTFTEVMVIIVFFSLFGAMVADVVEDSVVETGRRSEGVLFAARGFAAKMVSGVGVFLAGLIIAAAGLPTGAKPDEVPPEVLRNLVLYAAPAQILLYSTALFILRYYRISRAKHTDNLRTIAKA